MKRITNLLRWTGALGAALLGAGSAMAQLALPIEYRHNVLEDAWVNYLSRIGVPISQTVGNPAGSDGRQPGGNESTGTFTPPTSGQFSGFLALGGGPGMTVDRQATATASTVLQTGSTAFNGAVAQQMGLPVAVSGGQVAMILRRAQVGAPYLSRPVSFSFGSIVPPPEITETGALLGSVPNTAYWLPEPYTTNGHEGAGYYWSPHARQIYAIQPGPLTITWRKATPYNANNPPPPAYTNPNGPARFQTNGGNVFLLYTETYVVSGSSVKTPRKMYWTERGFQKTGRPVAVPRARVGAVNIIYNNSFPETVAQEFAEVGGSDPTAGSTNASLKELRTLWYDRDQKSIFAYNAEGRVFVELLGDLRPDGQTYVPLGIEIVDVSKQAVPSDTTIELGDRVVPPEGGSLDDLSPEPLQQGLLNEFAFRHSVDPAAKPQLYAVRETTNLNDYLVHWMESGVAGLEWPKSFGRYRFVWPTDMGRYSHYARTPAATEQEAMQTAVVLAPENAPFLAYQDPLDRPRAKFTPEFGFYTWLDLPYPIHRTLLRYSSGDNVAFERVLSFLSSEVQDTVQLAGESLDKGVGLERAGAESVLRLDASSGSYGQLPPGVYFPPGAFSVEARVYVREVRNWCRLIDFGNGPAANNVVVALSAGTSGHPRFEIQGDNGSVSLLGANTPLPLNRWVHLAVTFDGTIGRIYYDGVVVGQGAMTGFTQSTVRNLAYVGRSNWPDDLTNADIDNLRIWNRSLNSAELVEAAGREYPAGTSGLRAQFTFNRLENPAADSSGSGTPMTLHGNARTEVPGLQILTAPRFVRGNVAVGERIQPPSGELGASGSNYLAGYILKAIGTSYNPLAYVDPFVGGFEAANKGAIIPVNAIPGNNLLEVWWFRANDSRAGLNTGNNLLGFRTAYWPSVIGKYTIHWPGNPREIVMANFKGGTVSPEEAKGFIYYQNDPFKDGYNPNEEHAIMSGGTPFATRDDLNQTTAGPGYSSLPFVLVQYPANDGRPAMAPFRVLREKPEAGWVFDYVVPAGQMLQPPPPLNFLAAPVEGAGDLAVNYNTEPAGGDGDLPGGWSTSAENGRFGHYNRFTYRDRKHNFWVYRGPHAGLPPMEVGTYDPVSRVMEPMPEELVAVEGELFRFTIHALRQTEYLDTRATGLPAWLQVAGLQLSGTPPTSSAGQETPIELIVRDLYEQSTITNRVTVKVMAAGSIASFQEPLRITSTNGYTGSIVDFTTRAPFLAHSPAPSNSFTMRYYYKTEPSFAWPGFSSPPVAGSIVPYLRPLKSGAPGYEGQPHLKTTASLDIVYRPFWPVRDPKDERKPVPILPYGGTVAGPAFELPGVRDFKTAHVLYQQSVAANITNVVDSVVLHDATRGKFARVDSEFESDLPAGIRTERHQGKVYFPGLPPHLGKRLYLDPNIGPKGSLVLVGEYKRELLGESYLQLNVLRGGDLQTAIDLCPAADTLNYPKWSNLVSSLSSVVQTFRENLPLAPGTYVPASALDRSVGVEELAVVEDDNTAVDSYALSATGPGSGYVTLIESSGTAFTQPGDPVQMHIFRVGGGLVRGELKILPAENPLSELISFQHTPDLAGRFDEYEYEWKIAAPVDGLPPLSDVSMSQYLSLTPTGPGIPRFTLGGSGIQVLGDNYIVMRYRPLGTNHPLYVNVPTDADWSQWTAPVLAEGWIKRVLAGINPFNQRITDLFNNRVNTDVSLLTQAGRRWEGDVALNLDTINNYGLIEIYETVLRRGRSLSIESGFNYGPANDALLLAAGYLNDLYMTLGNEAWADASNPTIGIGTASNTYGDIATSLFSFRGQMPSLLEEELALLRGRDDILQPGVEITPVYNRLIWNYTRGIDAGEVVYALNYNIQENPDKTPDGIINAEDAAYLFPQGHGDAYGHYLTALKGYYSLLMNNQFDWVPRIEAVNVLGKAVSVDYQDERKFASAAAAVARTGRQIFDLAWRKDYATGTGNGWDHFSPSRVNTQRSYTTTEGTRNPERFWGMDHWASRVGQGAYLHWMVGNAILPHEDPDPTHEGIQKVDRTTVPELREIATLAEGLQTAMSNAEGGLSPLGIPEGGLAFDINPYLVAGAQEGTHFEQVYNRATRALNNAVAAFDDAKDVTRLMRSEQDSLAELQAQVSQQERAYEVALIELYGTPYSDDVGPGKLYKQGYAGPDLIHYGYVDLPEAVFPEIWSYSNTTEWSISLRDIPKDWIAGTSITTNSSGGLQTNLIPQVHYTHINFPEITNITFNIGPHGFAEKPSDWIGRRAYPGKIQQAISEQISAHMRLRQTINDTAGDLVVFQKTIDVFEADIATYNAVRGLNTDLLIADEVLEKAKFANDLYQKFQDSAIENIVIAGNSTSDTLPKSLVVGVASGGDLTFAGRAAIYAAGLSLKAGFETAAFVRYTIVNALELATSTARRQVEFWDIQPLEREKELRGAVQDIGNKLGDMQGRLWTINERLREYDDKQRQVRTLIAQGDTIQAEREIFRKRSAALVQGYRTRDAAFRVFRNEKLERYKTLFDLAARYSLLAANAYDYETGLLNSTAGREFKGRIINSRALGVVRDGQPQFAGSNAGDPGLSSVLAEMRADWDVVRGRLGFNSPDAYSTTVSMRTERFRILPGTDGDVAWRDALNRARMDNILDDADVRRFCLQVDSGDGLPVPGIVLTFSTTVADGLNLFGQPLAAGDSTFSPSSFATKIFAAGAAFEGYRGMGVPSANGSTAGEASAAEPGSWFLDPAGLSATPFLYLIPVGADTMRTPPLGDSSKVRTWNVEDLAIPLPFNVGAAAFANGGVITSGSTLSEELFARRKHQAFRAVPSAEYFTPDIYYGGDLLRSQYTNNRLIGRSIWNSQWKLVIPGRTLLNNPNEGLDRFIRTVNDIKLHFVTYSYSGN
jgi:hypothetical protein